MQLLTADSRVPNNTNGETGSKTGQTTRQTCCQMDEALEAGVGLSGAQATCDQDGSSQEVSGLLVKGG